MPLDLCTISGLAYKPQGGALYEGAEVKVWRASKSGVNLAIVPFPVYSDADGEFSIVVPRNCNIYVSGEVDGLWIDSSGNYYSQSNPKILSVPNAATANLEDLVAVSVVPVEGMTIQNNGTPLGNLKGTVNFVGFTLTEPSSSVVTVTDAGGGGGASALADLTDVSLTSLAANDFLKWDGADWINITIAQVKSDLSLNLVENAAASGLYQTLANKATDFSTVNNTLYPTVAAVKTYADTAVANLVDSSPSTLDTLNELAAALGDDPNFATTISTALGNKQPLNADLTAIAGLSLTNDDILQRKAGAWVNRTLAQLKSDLSLNLVENAALSSWAGSANLTTLGTIATGVWNGTAVAWAKVDKTGSSLADLATRSAGDLDTGTLLDARLSANVVTLTGAQTLTNKTLTSPIVNLGSDATGDIYYRNSGGALTRLPVSTNGFVLTLASGLPSWAAASGGVALGDSPNWTGVHTHTISNAAAWAIGAGGNTNPVLRIVTDVASQATGLSITGNASGAGATLTVLGGGTNEALNIVPKGFGYVGIQATGNYAILNFGNSTSANCAQIFSVNNEFVIGQLRNAGMTFQTNNNDRWNISAAGHFLASTDSAYTFGGATGNRPIRVNIAQTDGGTNTVLNALQIGRNSSGTPAVGLGAGILFQLKSSTTVDVDAGQAAVLWNTSTHASRSADYCVSLVHSAAALAEKFRIKSDSRMLFGVPNSAPTDGDISNSFATAYIDQTANKLHFRVRYSDGSYKTAEIALT